MTKFASDKLIYIHQPFLFGDVCIVRLRDGDWQGVARRHADKYVCKYYYKVNQGGKWMMTKMENGSVECM